MPQLKQKVPSTTSVKSTFAIDLISLGSSVAASMAEAWLERNQTQPGCGAERLHSVVNLKLVVNIGKMEIDSSL